MLIIRLFSFDMNSVIILKKLILFDVLICCVGCLYIYEIIKIRIVKKKFIWVICRVIW